MRQRPMSVPELMVVAATRGMLGFGVGLLVAERLDRRQRRRLAWPLVAVGALSTAPILMHVLRKPPIDTRPRLRRERERAGSAR